MPRCNPCTRHATSKVGGTYRLSCRDPGSVDGPGNAPLEIEIPGSALGGSPGKLPAKSRGFGPGILIVAGKMLACAACRDAEWGRSVAHPVGLPIILCFLWCLLQSGEKTESTSGRPVLPPSPPAAAATSYIRLQPGLMLFVKDDIYLFVYIHRHTLQRHRTRKALTPDKRAKKQSGTSRHLAVAKEEMSF